MKGISWLLAHRPEWVLGKGPAAVSLEERASIRAGLIALAWPAMVENILQALLGMVNMMMVGRLGAEAVAGVGLASQIRMLILVAFSGLAVGNTALVARYVGAKEEAQASLVAKQALLMGLGVAIVLGSLCAIFARELVSIFGGSPEVVALAAQYVRIISAGAIFMMVMTIVGGTLRGAGDTRTPMLVTGLSNVVNALLGYALIMGRLGLPAMGVRGAALANVGASAVGSGLILWALARRKGPVRLELRGGWRFDAECARRLFHIGGPSAVEQLIMRFGMMIYTVLVIGLGTVAYATQQVLFNLTGISMMTGFAFSTAATTIVGQSLGAKNQARAERSGWEAIWMGTLLMTAMGLLFIAIPQQLMRIYVTDPEMKALGVRCLQVLGPMQPIVAIAFVTPGALRGAGDTRWPMYVTAIGVWLLRLPLSWLFGVGLGMGLTGIWLGWGLDHLIRGGLLMWRYAGGKWKAIQV